MAAIKDVAKLAGVSVAAVSKYLKTPDNMREETRQRIAEAIRQLNYWPNPFAQSLRTGKTNIIAIAIGATLFFLRIPLPAVITGALQSVGSMIGPLSMIVAGMLIGGMDLLQVVKNPGVWKVTILRLIVYPLAVIALMRFSGASRLLPDGETILLVSLLSSVTPSAAAITQLAQIYSDEGEHAGAINVVTTVLCLVTIPIMISLYQL